jgi:hypothetical protein
VLLVSSRLERAGLASLLLACACRETPSGPTGGSARPAGPESTHAEPLVSAVPPGRAPAPSAPAPSPPAPAASVDYPPIAKSLTGPCDDPRALLAVRKEYDRSARIWLQQALLAHPEFELVSERPSAPPQVQVYETIYGVKNFSRSYAGQPRFSEALIARCADVATCNRLTAMFHAVSPRDGTAAVCNEPPGVTGGFSLVAELARERLRLPESIDSTEAACARVHACAARTRDARVAALVCRDVSADQLRACARAASCAEVVGCAAGATG